MTTYALVVIVGSLMVTVLGFPTREDCEARSVVVGQESPGSLPVQKYCVPEEQLRG